MKHTQKTLALLLSIILTAALVLTGCAAAGGTAASQSAPSPTAEGTPAQTPEAVQTQFTTQSYVSIDVNPSVRLIVQDGVVVDAKAFNDDGERILLDNDVTGLTPQEAIGIFIDAFAADNYITEEEGASLVITACGDDGEELIADLQEAATQRLNDLGLSCDVVVSTVTNQITEEAKQNGLTPGRYLLLKYIADQEGITLEEAKEKYGSLKMGKMIKLVDDVDAVFGHRDGTVDMQALVDSGILTPEQLEILTQAENAFKVAMQQAQQAFKQAKTQAQNQWQISKTEIQNAFKSDKDVQKWKSAKTALKAQLDQLKQAAIETFKQAKTQAQEQFRAAVSSLGLTDEQIAALIQWDFDFDWNFDYDWDEGSGETPDAPDEQSEGVQGSSGEEESSQNGNKQNDSEKPAGKDEDKSSHDNNGKNGKNE